MTRPADGSGKRDGRGRFEAAIEQYLRECYRTRTAVRASEFSLNMELTRQHVSETISEAFGKPLRDVLRERQLLYAAELLSKTPLRIDGVAAASGFGHRTTLHRAFVRAYGVSPTEYRKSRQSDKLPRPGRRNQR